MRFRSPYLAGLLILLLVSQQVADRIVALVNDAPILLSEVHHFSELQNLGGEEYSEMLENRLDGLINRKLMLQEIAVLRIFRVSTREVEQVRQTYIQRLGPTGLDERLQEARISMEEFNALIRESILIEKFVDYKFRRGTNIPVEEQRAYYENQFVPQMKEQGTAAEMIPAFNKVQEQIEDILVERRVTDRLQKWLTKRREQSQIVIRY